MRCCDTRLTPSALTCEAASARICRSHHSQCIKTHSQQYIYKPATELHTCATLTRLHTLQPAAGTFAHDELISRSWLVEYITLTRRMPCLISA